jgi:molybdopterin molybdotransferase
MAQLSDDSFAFGGPLMSVDEAGDFIRARIAPAAGVERLPLALADGRILAADLFAAVSLPPFDNSAVDGYAVRFSDLAPSGETLLPLRGRVPAGASAAGVATAGCAVRIFTGAIMPAGADTVFMQEDVATEGEQVRLPPGLKKGANCRLAGEDIAAGDLALPAGRRLGPAELALAAATGVAEVAVRSRLRIGVFSTGDELTEPGRPLAEAAIYDANRAMLREEQADFALRQVQHPAALGRHDADALAVGNVVHADEVEGVRQRVDDASEIGLHGGGECSGVAYPGSISHRSPAWVPAEVFRRPVSGSPR